jgi:hypothetical protein
MDHVLLTDASLLLFALDSLLGQSGVAYSLLVKFTLRSDKDTILLRALVSIRLEDDVPKPLGGSLATIFCSVVFQQVGKWDAQLDELDFV